MAREPMMVEVVCPREHEDERAHLAVKCLLCGNPRSARGRRFTATLAPGSRSELVQRLGEAAFAWGGNAALPTDWHKDRTWDALWSAIDALRQHDTEHGRTDGN